MKESYFDMSNGTNFQSDAPPSPGLVPACPRAMSIRKAQRADCRDGRDKRSDDQVETATSFAPLTLGARNPLIRRHFLGVFRFAKMALADTRT
jgi:hypothetical protein